MSQGTIEILGIQRGASLRVAYEQFRLRCDSKNLSAGSLAWYRQILGGFERFLVQRFEILDMESVAAGHIRAYLSWLKGRGLSSETVHRTFGGLRCFFKFLAREGILKTNPMELVERPRRERHLIQPLSAEQVRALVAQPLPRTLIGLRDRLLMLLMLDSGLRLSESLTLKLRDVDLKVGTALVLGKGRKERRVPFAGTTRQALEAYLQARWRIRTTSEVLIVSRSGRPLTSRHVQLSMRRYGRLAGIEGVRVSPHTLRHTCATQYIRNGGDPFSLQAILGHSTLEMVRNYVNLANRDVYEQHRKFSPMDRLLESQGGAFTGL